MQRTFQHWIATKWLEIGLDHENLHTKFSALNVDFSSPSPDSLSSKRPAQAGVKDGYPFPLEVVILPLLARVAWKRLQIGTDMLHIITSTDHRLLRVINNDDPERTWTPKRGFSEFFAIFGCSAHFNTEMRRNGRRQTKTACVWNFQR